MSIYSIVTSPLQERGCMFHKLFTRDVAALGELKDYLQKSSEGAEEELRLCSPASELPTFTKVALRKGQLVCFTGYVCRGHELIIDEALATSKSDLTHIDGIMNTCYYPLTQAELFGDFELVLPTFHTDRDQMNMVWQEVTLPGDVINSLGGRVTEREDVEIKVSYFVFGRTNPEDEGPMMSYVYFPVLEVHGVIPVDNINGAGDESWMPKSLLTQPRAKPSYRDGVTPTGQSMFELRQRSLKEEISDFIGSAGHQADDKFVATPAKGRQFIKSAYPGASVWAAHEDRIQGAVATEVTASPGKLHYVPQITTAAVGNSSGRFANTCTCGRPIVGDGTNMCECGRIPRSDLMVKQGWEVGRQLSAALPPSTTWDQTALAARFKQSIKAATAASAPATGVAAAPTIATATSPPAARTATTAASQAGRGGGGGSSEPDDDDSGSGSPGGGETTQSKPVAHSQRSQTRRIEHVGRSTLSGGRTKGSRTQRHYPGHSALRAVPHAASVTSQSTSACRENRTRSGFGSTAG